MSLQEDQHAFAGLESVLKTAAKKNIAKKIILSMFMI
jgi:hypothetical protein